MTLSATYEPAKYDCNGSVTEFTVQFPFFEDSDIVAYVIDSDGVVTELVQGSGSDQYTVYAPNNDYSSGATITTGTTYPSGSRLVIERVVPYGQYLDIGGDFVPAEPLEQQLDKLAAQIQQVKEQLDRTIFCPVSDSPDLNYEVGSESERAGKALGFDSSGNVTELALATGSGFSAVDTAKGLGSTGGTIFAKVDDSTTAFSSGNIIVKSGGIGATQLANGAVTTAKLASPTGADTNVVTGTKGTSGYLAVWNADGDLVNGHALIDDDTMATATATNIASAESVKAYVDGTLVSSANGYQIFSSGLIIQWGSVSVNANTAGSITFPTSFPTGCLQCLISFEYNGTTEPAEAIYIKTKSESGATFYNSANVAVSAVYFAIGH